MSENELLILAVIVFSLMCLGLGLTVREFNKMEDENREDKN